jgi:hypothetical protein
MSRRCVIEILSNSVNIIINSRGITTFQLVLLIINHFVCLWFLPVDYSEKTEKKSKERLKKDKH